MKKAILSTRNENDFSENSDNALMSAGLKLDRVSERISFTDSPKHLFLQVNSRCIVSDFCHVSLEMTHPFC